MMLLGETLMAEIVDFTINKTIDYTPWFPRQGDAVSSTCEVFAIGQTVVRHAI